MAEFDRPAGSYTPTKHNTNTTKYQDDAAEVPKVAISSVKIDGDINNLFDNDNILAEADRDQDYCFATDTGAADAYVITLDPAPTAYAAGMRVVMKATNTNTGASTINVNSLGTKTIKKNVSTDLAAADITNGQIVELTYDGTNFQLISVSASGALASLDTVDTAQIDNSAVTLPKMADLANMKVIGNTSGGTAAPAAVSILDEDTMSSDSATAVATQQSIKAYVDTEIAGISTSEVKAWITFDGTATTPTAADSLNVSSITDDGAGLFTINFTTPFSDSDFVMGGTGAMTSGGNATGQPYQNIALRSMSSGDPRTSSSAKVVTYQDDGSPNTQDQDITTLIFIGNQ